MSKNKIQFQIGFSVPEFIEDFGTEKKCEEYLEKQKWPNGYKCVDCQSSRYGTYKAGSRKVYQCKDCRKRHRLTAGTLFHGTKTELRNWFIAIYEITQSKNCISTMELHRHLGVNYKTAWLMKQKIMQLMYETGEKYKLKGKVEIDDAYLGGVNKGGKRGRGSENKRPFVAAVQCNEKGHPVFVKLSPVSGFTSKAIKSWAHKYLANGTNTVSDGLPCFNELKKFGEHSVLVTSKAKQEEIEAVFKWVNTILSNVKTSISGTFHAIDYRKYGFRYLADIEFRLNRRFDLRRMFFGLFTKALQSSPKSANLLNATLYG